MPAAPQGMEPVKGILCNSFKLFYANVSSLSNHAKDYLFSLPKGIKALALVECHEIDCLKVEDMFTANGFDASYNPAEKTDCLSHGGECVAVRRHLNSRPVMKEVLDAVTEYFLTPLRIACRIIMLSKLAFS